MGYKPIKQIHKIPYGWARQLSPFIKQIQSPPEAVIKFWSSPGKWRFTCNISQKIYSVISSFPLWSPVTSSEISHNRCYVLQPLMTALPPLWRFFQLPQQMDTFNTLCLKNIYIQTKTNITTKQCTLPITVLQCGHQGAPKPMSDCPGQLEI